MQRDAGNTFAKATTLPIGQAVNNRIGGRDRFDVYKISLSQGSSLNAQLNSRGAKVSMELFDGNFGRQFSSKSRSVQSMTEELGAGTYYIRIKSKGKPGKYQLKAIATPLQSSNPSTNPPPASSSDPGNPSSVPTVVNLVEDVGDFMATAYDAGTLPGTRLYKQQVTGTDVDVYKFQLSKTSNVSAQLTGVTGATYISILYDSDGGGSISTGDQITYDYASTNDRGEANTQLGAGTYYVVVQPYSKSDSSGYTLNLSAQEVLGLSDSDPGSSIVTAKPVSFENGSATYKDFIGSTDKSDVYKVTFTQGVRLNAFVNGLKKPTQLYLLSDSYGRDAFGKSELGYDYGASGDNISLTRDLGAGTYFVYIRPDSSSSYDYNSVYNLTLSYQTL
jgi:Bacterial pre-peptidase C-terminal domain